MIRIDRKEMLSQMVRTVSQRSTCLRRQVGALIVLNNRVISMGYVGSPPGQPHCIDAGCIIGPDGGCIRTVHAEANAIAYAAREGVQTEGTDMWTTVSPCLSCAKLIISAGIQRVFALELYRTPDGMDLLRSSGVHSFLIGNGLQS